MHMHKSPSCPELHRASSGGGLVVSSLSRGTSQQKILRPAVVPSALPLESYPAWMPGLSETSGHVSLHAPLAHRERDTVIREPIRDFENEVELESSMHVTWFSSMQCEAAYGFPQLQSAPDLHTTAPGTATGGGGDWEAARVAMAGHPNMPQSALTYAIQHANSTVTWPESPRALAACLATPIEPPTELPERPHNRVIASNGGGARAMGAYELAVAELSEEVGEGAREHWTDWTRRLRRNRRISDIIQAILMMMDAPNPAFARAGGHRPDGPARDPVP